MRCARRSREELVEDRRGVRRRAGHRHGGFHQLRRRRGVHPLPAAASSCRPIATRQTRSYARRLRTTTRTRWQRGSRMRDGRRARATSSLKSAMETYGLYRFDGMSLEDFRSGAVSADAIVSAAYSQLGVVWGGTTPGVGLDCSGLTQYCYRQAGSRFRETLKASTPRARSLPVGSPAGRHPLPNGACWHLHRGRPLHPRAPSGRGREDRERDLELHLRPVVSIDKEQEDGQEDETDGHMRRRRCGDPYRGRARALCDSPFRARDRRPLQRNKGQQIEQADDSFQAMRAPPGRARTVRARSRSPIRRSWSLERRESGDVLRGALRGTRR